jgi:hypothetical protein
MALKTLNAFYAFAIFNSLLGFAFFKKYKYYRPIIVIMVIKTITKSN